MKLHDRILIGLVAGAAAGIALRVLAPGAQWVESIATGIAEPAGKLFLRLLLLTVVPLVLTSIFAGVAGLGDARKLGRVGAWTLGYFLVSTLLGAGLGLLLVNLIEPGAGIDAQTRDQLLATYRAQGSAPQATGFSIQTLLDIVPVNPVRAAAEGQMLGVIFFAMLFGAAATMLPRERSQPAIAFMESFGAVTVKVIDLVLRIAPYGVFALIFAVTARFGWALLAELGSYVGVVLAGLLLHSAVTLSALVAWLGRMNPWRFWKNSRTVAVTAFSTSSSSATLPTSLAVARRELGVPEPVAGFVLPLGATLNMNGTALFEGVTVLFLARLFGVELGLGAQAVVLLMCVLTAIGTAGVPGGSIPLLMGVLVGVGVPAEAIGVILGVDRLLDMCRTTVNVTGDLSAAVVVARRLGGGAVGAGAAETGTGE